MAPPEGKCRQGKELLALPVMFASARVRLSLYKKKKPYATLHIGGKMNKYHMYEGLPLSVINTKSRGRRYASNYNSIDILSKS